ncbi:MAG: hypothetical protein DRN65_03730 [Thaumarchaeota archaeon]|nr:MAG: hypothetical protein DRN47_06480 [Candidatus Wolframiiraptor sp.]RLG07316.1 MAG: hypothetical protein DRN65_03730 [Nitrososphaerota archaeon]
MSEEYKREHVFGLDYGTSDFKFGPITLGEVPEVVENRGYFIDSSSLMSRLMGVRREVIVGKDVPRFLESREDLAERMVYPMRNGIIPKDDVKAWRVIKELTKYALESFAPKDESFQGFYVVASISVVAPRYMYEKLFEIFKEMNEEKVLVNAATIIPQPLAVAIAHKIPTCTVVESGHGNTQVCPISMYPIRNAVIALNRGGDAANILTAEILKDAGYGDLAKEESLVRRVKEEIGLLPKNLDDAIRFAKENPDEVRVSLKIPGTRVKIDLEDLSWTRFLIGEYVFNPGHEIFQSYFARGMPKPSDVKIGDTYFYGMMDMAESIVTSVEKCSIELQPYLYSKILLSGGNFGWSVPKGLEQVATTSDQKLKSMLTEKGVENVDVVITGDPKFSVWRGCIVYGYAVPADYEWKWEKLEGWMNVA